VTDQYFSEQPGSASDPVSFRLDIGGVALELTTDAGVFARGRLDKGTRVLLEHAPEPADGDLLDLGCGYGPVAVTLARRAPAARVWAVDVNRRALSLCAANAAAAGVEVRTATPDEVPADLRFTGIWSNPPVRIGKEALHQLLAGWLDRLSPEGRAALVVHRHLGADSLARWLAAEGWPTARTGSRMGYRLLEVRPRPAGSEDAHLRPSSGDDPPP
jgi:16S rRNA (guanine1207-N2)-methyltransferase